MLQFDKGERELYQGIVFRLGVEVVGVMGG